MRNKIIAVVVITTMLAPVTKVLAISANEVKKINSQRALAQDVFIDGLYENSTLYVGGDIKIKGAVDSGATNKEIQWQVTGNNGIIDFSSNGEMAKVTGRKSGKVWVMARATDGSDRAREYTVAVSDYPKDSLSQSLVNNNITPILKRPLNGSNTVLRVEVKKELGVTNKKNALEGYLRELSKQGNLSNKGTHSDSYYEYYIISTNSKNIEVRIEKSDSAYQVLKSVLVDVSRYNGGNTESGQPPIESEKPQVDTGMGEKPSISGGIKPEDVPQSGDDKSPINNGGATQDNNQNTLPPLNKDEDINTPVEEGSVETDPDYDITLGVDNIINVGGSGVTPEDAFVIMVDSKLQVSEKIESLSSYLTNLRIGREVSFVKKINNTGYMSYIFKISKKIEYLTKNLSTTNEASESQNDFFIEIRVDKNDKEAYEPIIEMLDNETVNTKKVVLGKNEDAQEEKDKKTNGNFVVIGLVSILGTAIILKKFIMK